MFQPHIYDWVMDIDNDIVDHILIHIFIFILVEITWFDQKGKKIKFVPNSAYVKRVRIQFTFDFDTQSFDKTWKFSFYRLQGGRV